MSALNFLLLSSILGIPAIMGAKRGIENMKYREPLNVRLRKLDIGTSEEENNKVGSENNSLFNMFKEARQKLAGDSFIESLFSGVGKGIGKPFSEVFSPAAQQVGYNLQKKLFPGISGMIASKQIPEEAMLGAAKSFSQELGSFSAQRLSQHINKVMDRNNRIIYDSPRRKLILDQLMKEDSLISKMPMETALSAYHSMVDVAPTLSVDKNAVKSYLRTVAMAPEGGVDWNTLKGLADAEHSILKAKEMKMKI